MNRGGTGPLYRKIMVVSDTHGDYASLKRAYTQCEPEFVIHLGDGVEELLRLARIFAFPFEAVNGNNDPREAFPEESVLEIGGVRLLLLHGHRGGDILSRAKQAKAHWVLQGHSHRPDSRVEHGIHWLNPGPLCFHLSGGRPSFILLTWGDRGIEAKFYVLENCEIRLWTSLTG